MKDTAENPKVTSQVNTAAIKAKFPLKWFLLVLLLIIAGAWLWFTPPGFWGKLGAIGYAVCHQIAARSYHVHDQQVPLCARCTGMYLGAMLGIVFQLVHGKKGAYPPLKTILIMALMVVAFGLDGVNSYIHFFPSVAALYEPHNTLRLITGTGMGLAISAAIVPAFHQTIWVKWQKNSGLGSWKQLGLLLILAALLVLAVLSGSSWAILSLAIISTGSVFILLTMIYSMVWVMLLKKENTYTHFKQLTVPLLGGVLTALLQIGAFDLARYLLTGTWAGLNL